MNVVLVYRGRYHVREALDLETLSALLAQAGHRVTFVYDPDTFGVTDNVFQVPALARLLSSQAHTIRRIREAEPDVVLFSAPSSTYRWCREVASAVRGRAPIVFFGLHASLVPERVMREPSIDYVIAGETENAILPLLDRIGGDVSEIGNLWYRRDDRVIASPRAPLVDLDALPLPDKELFAPYVTQRYSYAAMVSRGCPYDCSFCEETCGKRLHGAGYFRRKSVDAVLRELVAGKRRYDYREVIFKDSYLSGNKRWLRELMERYRREIGVPFKCFCTIHGFDEETLLLLRDGGCYSIELGLQTWNDRVRGEILNRRETAEDALEVFRLCDRHRVRYDVDHMFGIPTEREEDHALGAERYMGLAYLGRVKVHHLVVHPAAEILEHAMSAGDLPADAADRLAEGLESDFYDHERASRERSETNAGYAALYKLLPMLPERMTRALIARGRVRHLRRIPSPVMAALQAVQAARAGDLRFAAYLRLYPRKIVHTVLRYVVQTSSTCIQSASRVRVSTSAKPCSDEPVASAQPDSMR